MKTATLILMLSGFAAFGQQQLLLSDYDRVLYSTNPAPMVLVGGIQTLSSNASVSGGSTTAGRTFFETLAINRINKKAWISGASLYVAALGANTNAIKFKVARPNGTQWDIIGTTALITLTATGSNYFSFSTPLECNEGDCVGLWVSGYAGTTGPTIAVKTDVSSPGIRYETGDITGTNQSLSSNLSNYALDLGFYGDAPVIAFTGDSITAGHNVGSDWYPFLDSGGIPISGRIVSSYPYCWSTNGGSLVSYKNYSKGGETFAWVDATSMGYIISDRPLVLWIMCGVNDVSTSRTWSQVETNLNSIRTQFTNTLFISEILPWTAGSAANAETIRTWNTNLSYWVTTNSATLGKVYDDFANGDDMKAAYDQDGVHLTQAGVSNYVRIMDTYLRQVIKSP